MDFDLSPSSCTTSVFLFIPGSLDIAAKDTGTLLSLACNLSFEFCSTFSNYQPFDLSLGAAEISTTYSSVFVSSLICFSEL